MAIFLTGESRVMIQGITGSEGTKHGRRMLAAGTTVVGGTNPRKAGQTVDLGSAAVPVFGTVAETMAATGADVSVVFVPVGCVRNPAHPRSPRGRTPVDLFEYQAKELFAEYGVPVQRGRVASTPEEAREIAEGFAAEGSSLVVVKAQVKTGGRGKAGGVKLANGPDEAEAKARQILGMDIKGHTVHKVLMAEAVDIAQEYYLSFLLDRAARTFVAICSVQGGMEIEEVAHTNPEAVARIPVNPLKGVDAAKAAEIIQAGRIPAEAAEQAALLAERLWAVFADEDATLVEVNPMALTDQGAVLAVDGKVSLDDNAVLPPGSREVRGPRGGRPARGAGPRPST